MIKIIDTGITLHPELMGLLSKLMRGHVSKFPVEVRYSADGNVMSFIDPRFPTNNLHDVYTCVAIVERTKHPRKGVPLYMVRSTNIRNDKYASSNNRYHSKETANIALAFKWVKEYVHPLEPGEIYKRSALKPVHASHYAWQNESMDNYRKLVEQVKTPDLIKELSKQLAVGTKFFDENIRKLAEEGLALMEESQRRVEAKAPAILVYRNPDDSWAVVRNVNSCATYGVLDMVPEDIKSNLSILQMMDPGAYVPYCGYRATDKLFWVNGNDTIPN
jgi:hypothetical protein